MPNVNLSPLDAQQAALNRRRALALALQQQSMEPIAAPPVRGAQISPVEGIAKLAQALVGGLSNRRLDKEQAALSDQQQQQRESQALALSNTVTPQPQGLTAPMAQPQEAQIPGENAVPAQSAPPMPTTLPVGPGQAQGREQAVSALARALTSQDPMMAESGRMLLQNQLTGTTQQRDQAAQMARLLAGQTFTAGQKQLDRSFEGQQARTQQQFVGGQNDLNRGVNVSEGAADRASREKIAGMKEPPAKSPGYRDVETKDNRIVREYFDQADPSVVTYSKDIGPVPARSNPETAGERALNTSSQHNLDLLSKGFTPITASLQKISQGQALMAANNPAANSLVAPTILEALVSGQGTGFRMTQPEIDAVNKGQGRIGNFQNWLSAWSVDPEKYTALNADQKKWLNGVLEIAKQKANAKVDVYEKASDSIINGKSVKDHQTAYRDALTKWSAIDSGAPVKAQMNPMDAVDKVFGPAPKVPNAR